MEFFDAGLAQRRRASLHPASFKAWAYNLEKRWKRERLLRLCPSLACVTPVTGLHASAYLLDDCVVKTNMFSSYFHDGQMSWLEWCLQNQTNPLVPKVAFLHVDPATERYLVVMEKLKPHAGFEYTPFLKSMDNALVGRFRDFRSGPNAFLQEMQRIQQAIATEIQTTSEGMDCLDDVEDDELIAILQKDIAMLNTALNYHQQLLDLNDRISKAHLRHFMKMSVKFNEALAEGREVDVHSYNWMLRTDGTPVVIDPIN